MDDISLHILDIVENSITAEARTVAIRIAEDTRANLLVVEIEDDGRGMDEATVGQALDPFFTTRTTRRVGLGLPMFAQSAREAGGGLEISSKAGRGTRTKATFRTDHPDCRPLGDIGSTLQTLIAGHPEVGFVYEHVSGEEVMRLDTRDG